MFPFFSTPAFGFFVVPTWGSLPMAHPSPQPQWGGWPQQPIFTAWCLVDGTKGEGSTGAIVQSFGNVFRNWRRIVNAWRVDVIFDHGFQPTTAGELGGVLLSIAKAPGPVAKDLTITYALNPAVDGDPPSLDIVALNDFDPVDSFTAITIALLGRPVPGT